VKAVVVGASSGLGRCIGIGLAQRGAEVALMARRRDRLVEAAKEAGPGTLAIGCDVTDADICRAAIDEAAHGLGGIDAIVYTPAIGALSRLIDTDTVTWRRLFDTNVIGAAHFTAAAIPYLTESRGAAAYLSTVSASATDPWPGLGAYLVSKAALDKLVEAWRAEYPMLNFTRVVVGDCAGGEGHGTTEFPSNWDWNLAGGCPASTTTLRSNPGLAQGLRRKGHPLATIGDSDLYYDPYDFEIDADPYPLWKRMRDEAPLYYNEKYDFFALSRFDDVEPALVDWRPTAPARVRSSS
jgi:NAD(P)-dependent dehydrogenase (short-subunit alcohol dehydrogenase family)